MFRSVYSRYRTDYTAFTLLIHFGKRKSSLWRICHHWLHRKLSFPWLMGQPIMVNSSKLRPFCFIECITTKLIRGSVGVECLLCEQPGWSKEGLRNCWNGKSFETFQNLLGPNDAIWLQGSGSGLAQVMACCLTAPKPLPEPMLTYHQNGPVIFIWGQFPKRYLRHQSLKWAWKLFIQNSIEISQGSMN